MLHVRATDRIPRRGLDEPVRAAGVLLPLVGRAGQATLPGYPACPLEGHPGHQRRVGEALPAAAGLPDALVGLLPVLGEPVQLAGERLPQLEGDRRGELVVEVHRVHELAVDVELELPGGAVADPHGFRVAVAAQVLEDDLVEVGVAVHAVQDVQALVAGGLLTALFQPVHERGGLVGEPERHERVDGERGVADPRVPVVPVADATELLRQGGGGRRHQCSGGTVDQQFEHERGAVHHLPPAAVVAAAAQPVLPVGQGTVEQLFGLAVHQRADRCVPLQDDVRALPHVERERRGDAGAVAGQRDGGTQGEAADGGVEHRALAVDDRHCVGYPPVVEARVTAQRELGPATYRPGLPDDRVR